MLLALLAACSIALLGALPASAHAKLVRSSPSAGSSISAVPPEVMLQFNEVINPQFSTVTVKSGNKSVRTGEITGEGDTVYAPIDPSMADGRYTVAYKVTSADGHPVSGTFTFTYNAGSGGEGPDEDSPTDSPTSSPTETSSPTSSASPTDNPTSSSSGTTSSPTETTSSPTETTSSPTETTSTPSPTSSETGPTGTDETSSDSGWPWWVWLLLALGGGAIIGAVVAAQRGRREQDEYDERFVDDQPYDEPRDARDDGRDDRL